MQFGFDKPTCQNIRKSLRQEWLETNGRGDYASSTLTGCNTRKYHGLFVTDLTTPPGRHVLLSTVEESLLSMGREVFISCRAHPGLFHPRGHEYQHSAEIGNWPRFEYHFGDVIITRELMFMPDERRLVLRYTRQGTDTLPETPTLRIKPLLAFRHMHAITRENMDLQVKTWPAPGGFGIRPYNNLPQLFMQADKPCRFLPAPDWFRNVRYLVEEERGFPSLEDLFNPGVLEIPFEPGMSVHITVGCEEYAATSGLNRWWKEETKRREAVPTDDIVSHLSHEAARFLVRSETNQPGLIAGYHWFNMWGRDTCIALPGLTFVAGRPKEGVELLVNMAKNARDGVIPNMFSQDGNHSYNSVDASLWYVWAVQMMRKYVPEADVIIYKHCWPFIKRMINAYSTGRVEYVHRDEQNLLRVGTPDTQLTWMDAQVHGRPVTPRNGYPVEINALWYNALAFADKLARRFGEPELTGAAVLKVMRDTFLERFWVKRMGGYLADVWRPDDEGGPDRSVRPNQIYAVSLPHAILADDNQSHVVEIVTKTLLTPYGLRTLWPGDPSYKPICEGDSESRDGAYHQGTVWPWLLGAYADALLRNAWEPDAAVRELLSTLNPLFTTQLRNAGIGSISEIFNADPPHEAGGCIAQAWSVGECLRLLRTAQELSPLAFKEAFPK